METMFGIARLEFEVGSNRFGPPLIFSVLPLCPLCLCSSVRSWNRFHHRDTEGTEVTQRFHMGLTRATRSGTDVKDCHMKLLLILLLLGILPALFVGQSKERLVGTGPSFKGPVGLQLYS